MVKTTYRRELILIITTLFDSITVALYDEFGASYTYYVEDVEQNFIKPSFTVGTLEPSIRSISPTRYHRIAPIIVYYFSDKASSHDKRDDNLKTAERLISALEYLKVDDCTLRGEKISWDEVDGVLQFFITYEFDVENVQAKDKMEHGAWNGSKFPERKD